MGKIPRPGRRFIFCFSAFLFFCFYLVVLTPAVSQAQPAVTPPAENFTAPKLGEGPMLWELFILSPIINSIILLLSIAAVLLFIYFMMTITPQTMAPPLFVDEISKLVRHREHKEAAEYCRRQPNVFIACIVQRCLENAGRSQDVMLSVLDAEGRRRADLIWNRISYLADISAVAPMFGLLGTVVGMINAFYYGLTRDSASINSALLASSVGQAMGTTMFGLVVGIMALMFYSVVKGRLTRVLGESEQIVHSLADQMCGGEAA